jgi:hypothetical protein
MDGLMASGPVRSEAAGSMCISASSCAARRALSGKPTKGTSGWGLSRRSAGTALVALIVQYLFLNPTRSGVAVYHRAWYLGQSERAPGDAAGSPRRASMC